MTSPDDGDPLQHPPPLVSQPSLYVAKTRSLTRDLSPETSSTGLPVRTSSPIASTRASVLSRTLSRSQSPIGRRSQSTSRGGQPSVALPLGNVIEVEDDIRSLIVRACAPTVAVYASEDTNLLAQQKGLRNGLVDLLRPFGERVSGKVVVRDSVGASRAWDDFGIHFVDLADPSQDNRAPPRSPLENLEDLLQHYVEQTQDDSEEDTGSVQGTSSDLSPYYRVFLTRLLASRTFSHHEAYLHPTSCVITISSHTASPIDTLRTLYAQTAHGNRTLPLHANPEYLRYYVLVHDEDNSDFSKSSALFDQMKRHFGLHCHLLRLRSTPCSASDDEAIEVPVCEWLSPSEDLTRLNEANNLFDPELTTVPHLFESDIQAISIFIRELVAQSVVPHMENRIALWNEQVASRRRGISGRFMSLSKRWVGSTSFGSRTASPTAGGPSGSSGNYDAVQGIYRHDTPEAQLRKMADYSFMLRDFKFASSTYDLLRTDFANDKAWKYLAGANEMSVIASLLNPLTNAGMKGVRIDELEKGLETAIYSYLARCNDIIDAVRAVVVAVELLKVRGRVAAELAAKWAIRALDIGSGLAQVGKLLLSERIVGCFADQTAIAGQDKAWGWGRRKRKAGLWSAMVANEWLKLGKVGWAGRRTEDAERFFEEACLGRKKEDGWHQFDQMYDFMQQLHGAVRVKRGQARGRGLSQAEDLDLQQAEDLGRRREIEQTTEQVERLDSRAHRRSMMGTSNVPEAAAPLSPAGLKRLDPLSSRDDDDFE